MCTQVLVHVAYAKLTNFERQVASHPPRAHTFPLRAPVPHVHPVGTDSKVDGRGRKLTGAARAPSAQRVALTFDFELTPDFYIRRGSRCSGARRCPSPSPLPPVLTGHVSSLLLY